MEWKRRKVHVNYSNPHSGTVWEGFHNGRVALRLVVARAVTDTDQDETTPGCFYADKESDGPYIVLVDRNPQSSGPYHLALETFSPREALRYAKRLREELLSLAALEQ